MPKIRNILIFVIIAVILALIYFFIIKASPNQGSLVSTPNTTLPDVNGSSASSNTPADTSAVAKDFVTLLLSVQSIKLDDAIFSDPAFNGLHDSSITLTPDAVIGRPNPFAQFGADNVTLPPDVSGTN